MLKFVIIGIGVKLLTDREMLQSQMLRQIKV